jgi:hypothetical protein
MEERKSFGLGIAFDVGNLFGKDEKLEREKR